ncbi:hypothetical protein ACQZV8_11145 [Magnetococcales bacterium HHB-1]
MTLKKILPQWIIRYLEQRAQHRERVREWMDDYSKYEEEIEQFHREIDKRMKNGPGFRKHKFPM